MDRLINSQEVRKAESMILDASNVVLTCHVRPDGDAIGSTLGLMHLLRALGKNAGVVVPDRPPRTLSFLPGFKDVSVYTLHEPYCRRLVQDADLIICCDFNTPSRQDSLAPLIQEAPCRKMLLDHHQEPVRFTDLVISYPDMSSTCELAFRLIAELGLYNMLNLDAATCLLTGLITDTRNFSVNCNHHDIYEVLMRLLDKGCDKTRIVREALLSRTYWSLRLESFALSEKMQIIPQSRCAIITLSHDELTRFHYERGDTEGLSNRPTEIIGVISSFFLREDSDCIKISARSIENFPVSKVCSDLFGGGGHIMAAGAEFYGSLEECKRRIEENISRYDSYIPKHLPKLEIG